MKKLVLIVALAAITFGASAQGFSWGIKAGMNVSNIGGKDTDNNKNKIGYFAGLAAEYAFSDTWAIAPEVLYSAQGFKVKEGDVTASFKGDYINVPIFAKYYLTDNWSVGLGPQLGFNVSAKVKTKVDGETATQKIDSDLYNSFDFGMGIATSYKITDNLYVDARYNYGFTKVFKDAKNYNRVFQLGVGYNF